MYSELMKETEDDTNRWKDTPCSWIRRINIVKMTKAISRFNAITIKIPMALFTGLEEIKLFVVWKFVRKHKRPE